MIEISYNLRIQNLYQSGTGTGLPGYVDEFTLRDPQGFAYLPASHIKGVVRQNCYRLLAVQERTGLICKSQQTWQSGETPEATDYCIMQNQQACPMCALFGSPFLPARLLFSSARMEADFRDKAEKILWEANDSFPRAQASIDLGTRRARPHHLFSSEAVCPATPFIGKVQLDLDLRQEAAQWQAGLAIAALLFTRRIGGKRSRGLGRCRFEIELDTPDGLLKKCLLSWLDGDKGGSGEKTTNLH